MDSNEIPILVKDGRARKRKRNEKNSIKELLKIEKYKPKRLPKKPSCSHSSKKLECRRLQTADITSFANGYYKSKDKLAQDAYILIYCKVETPNRTDRHVKNGARKEISIGYSIRKDNGKLVKVCQKAFCGILNIGRDRVQRICKRHLRTGAAPVERRGGDRKFFKYLAKKRSIIRFVQKLRCIEIHYCRGKTKRQYLPSELSINKLYTMYCVKTSNSLQVKRSYFRHVFNTNFNIGFKAPATDVCSTCQMFKETITLETDDKKKQILLNQFMLHKRRAKAFFKLLKAEKPKCLTLSFDCEKNMAIPKLFDQAAYFSRRISLYNFGIVQGTSRAPLTKKNVYLYTWGEYERVKGSNEIASAVFHRLCLIEIPETIECIRLFADGCGGQNKNSILMTMCSYWLSKKSPQNVKKIEVIFPVVGHSFLPPDRVFAQIEKGVKAKESIVSPEEYVKIFEEFGTVTYLCSENCPVLDFKRESADYCKPPGNWHFKFNASKRFVLTKTKNNIEIRGEASYLSDLNASKPVWKRGKRIDNITPERLPSGEALKAAKVDDVKKLLSKHFGKKWRSMNRLSFLNRILPIDEKERKSLEKSDYEDKGNSDDYQQDFDDDEQDFDGDDDDHQHSDDDNNCDAEYCEEEFTTRV